MVSPEGSVATLLTWSKVFCFSETFPTILGGDKVLWEKSLSTLRESEFTLAKEKVAGALSFILNHCPEVYPFILSHVDTIFLRDSREDFRLRSSSNRDWPGAILLCDVAATAPIDLAEWIVHEAIHQWLYELEQQTGLFHSASETEMMQLKSPWSGNSIHADSFVHGTFVWFGLTHFFRRVLRTYKDRAVFTNLSTSLRGFQNFECFRLLDGETDYLSPFIRRELRSLREAARSLQLP